MVKLTEAQKNQIRIEYAAGATASELGRKFQVSHTAINKVLKSFVKDKETAETSEVSTSTPKVSNRDHAKDIVANAYKALSEYDCKKLPPDFLLKLIERMSAIYGVDELEKVETEKVEGIVIEIEDASTDED